MQTQTQKKVGIALNSVFASILLTATKLVVGLLSGSIGILSEAAHSALDFVAAFITYLTVRVSDNPADKTHHYGHGKIESISALVETLLLFVTSGWIIYESIHRLMSESVEIDVTWYALGVIVLSIIVDISRSRALYKVAKETNSQALEADALHFKSDIYSSAVVFVGLILVALGFKGADAIAAICVALFVVHAGYELGKRTIDVLLDTAPQGITEKIKEIVDTVDEVIDIKRIRVRPAGPSVFIDMSVNINRKTPLERTHKITQKIEQKIMIEIPHSDVVVHISPIAVKDETIIERVQIVATSHNLIANDIHIQTAGDKKRISFTLEVKQDMTLEEAHRAADHIEQTLHKEFDANTEINIHIEPMNKAEEPAEEIKGAMTEKLNLAIESFIKINPLVKNIHDMTFTSTKSRTGKNKIFVSFHCVTDGKISIVEAHDLSEQFEEHIRQEVPGAEKAMIHMEPEDCHG